MTAKAEIADYSIATRFGKGKKIIHDRRIARANTRAEAVRQIETLYRENKWNEAEQATNSRLLGLDVSPLESYTDKELKIILDDAEKHGMILFCEE